MEIKPPKQPVTSVQQAPDFSLRPYQITALEILHSGLNAKDILLLQAATGAGKTIIIVRMIRRYFFDHPGRSFLVLMHKRELVEQFARAFFKFTDIPAGDIGIACAGVQVESVTDRRITIASVQTLVNQIGAYPGADLVVVDETHRVGHDDTTQYRVLLDALRKYRPDHKTIGVTATAYRLGHGMIYGDQCRPGRQNFFPELTHRITYKELVAGGYLMKLTGRIATGETLTADLKDVAVSGDYVISQLGDVMSRTVHIQSAVDGFEKYGAANHKSVCVFACTIEHAELLCKAFQDRGHSAVTIHSKLPEITREANLKHWQRGTVKIAVSVNILIEGFDFPALSCLVFCRPTKSPTLFVQAIGRILRTAPGKEEALLIDLTDNTLSFGTDLDNPQFTIPKGAEGEGEAPSKVCQGTLPSGEVCGAPVHASLMYCPVCGFAFPRSAEVEAALGTLKAVTFSEPEEFEVHSVEYRGHQSRGTGKNLLRVIYSSGTIFAPRDFSDYVCFPDEYTGYAVERAKEWWEERTTEPFPVTLEEAFFLADTLATPKRITVVRDGKYSKIVGYDFDGDAVPVEVHSADDVPF